MSQPIESAAPKGGALSRPLPAPRLGRALALASNTFVSLPATFRVGFALLAAGAIADIGYHAIFGLQPAHGHGSDFDVAMAIHLLVGAGMFITLAGLVRAAIRFIRPIDDRKEAL